MKGDIFVQTSDKLRELIARQIHSLITQPHTFKTLVIAALALRGVRLNGALLTLACSGFRDEATALARILTEVVINCGYLLVAGEQEFKAFVAFPVTMLGKHHRAYLAHSHDQTNFNDEFNQLVATAAEEAIQVSGRSTKDSSWTSESVYKRSLAADAVFQDGLFALLAITVYAEGHDFVHGNFSSIVSLMDNLRGADQEHKEGNTEEQPLLHAAALSLLACALSLNKHFRLNFGDELQSITVALANNKDE